MNYEGTSKGEAEHFLSRVIKEDMESGVYTRPVATRFPPEPNGTCILGARTRSM